MSKLLSFPDGTVYVERPGTRWGRVGMSKDSFFDQSKELEVAFIAVNDITPPPSPGKGSTMPMHRSWFDYLDAAHSHTKPASNWMRTPFMLWFNRHYVGDPTGNTTGDPEPVLECITGSGNILRVIGETASHYEIWALPITDKPSYYNPAVFNFRNYPWIFWKAQARNKANILQRVGAGLEVYHVNFRKPQNRHWISKDIFTLFRTPPFEVTWNNVLYLVIDYQFVGANIYGITSEDGRIPLLISGTYATDWRGPGQAVV